MERTYMARSHVHTVAQSSLLGHCGVRAMHIDFAFRSGALLIPSRYQNVRLGPQFLRSRALDRLKKTGPIPLPRAWMTEVILYPTIIRAWTSLVPAI